jgi:hypothetical protein
MTPRSAAEDPFPTVFLDPLAWIPMETVSNILGHYPGAVGLALLTNGTLIITVGPNTDMEILEFFSPQVICVTPTSGRADRENPPDYIKCRGPTGSGSRYSCGVVVELQGEQYLTIGGLRRAFLSWISEFPTRRISIAVNHLQPKPALNPETSKKE